MISEGTSRSPPPPETSPTPSPFHHLGVPGTLNAALDRLVRWAFFGLARKCPVHLIPRAGRNLETVAKGRLTSFDQGNRWEVS
jgi:hypothetical protein